MNACENFYKKKEVEPQKPMKHRKKNFLRNEYTVRIMDLDKLNCI
jgi:hypothetical protein